MSNDLKTQVHDFWDREACGEVYAHGLSPREQFDTHAEARYELEPYLREFAGFESGAGKDVLEIGVGMGADHVEWAKSNPRSLTGVDLTERAVELTQRRLEAHGFQPNVSVSDAEQLPFDDESFDIVFSWGVLHHTPDTRRAIHEVWRVLRPSGTARLMLYHKYSLTGYMLWVRYALLRGRLGQSLDDIYAAHLESPGTKAFSAAQVRDMCGKFSRVEVRPQLCFGDLLEGEVGQRHRGPLLATAKRLWPRWFLRRVCKNHGLDLLIEAVK